MTCTAADGTKTTVGEDDAWSFAVIGDPQRNPAVTAKIAKLMWDRRPHFAIHRGGSWWRRKYHTCVNGKDQIS